MVLRAVDLDKEMDGGDLSKAGKHTMTLEHFPEIEGLRIGQVTDIQHHTGGTVVLAEGGAVAGVDVRGGAPGTHGTDALRPENLVDRLNAVVLTGGSAFPEDDIAKDLDTLPGMVSGTRKDATRPRGTGDSVEDFLRFYQSPIPGITLEIAEEAVDVLSSDCSYAEWLDVAMALRHQFEDQEFEAYQLFDR